MLPTMKMIPATAAKALNRSGVNTVARNASHTLAPSGRVMICRPLENIRCEKSTSSSRSGVIEMAAIDASTSRSSTCWICSSTVSVQTHSVFQTLRRAISFHRSAENPVGSPDSPNMKGSMFFVSTVTVDPSGTDSPTGPSAAGSWAPAMAVGATTSSENTDATSVRYATLRRLLGALVLVGSAMVPGTVPGSDQALPAAPGSASASLWIPSVKRRTAGSVRTRTRTRPSSHRWFQCSTSGP